MTIYIGPYIRVPAVTRDEPKSGLFCSANCGGSATLTRTTRFCPDCGAPVETRKTKVSVRRVLSANYAADDIDAKFVDLMSSSDEAGHGDYQPWIPNHAGFGKHLHRGDLADVPFDVADELRESAIAKFLAYHGEFIAAVEAHYGVVPTVHYGVVIVYF